MLLYDPNSRGSRIVKNILSAIVTLAVIVSAANFVQNTTSNTYQDLEPQMTTMQGIRQTAQDSVTFAQSMENPDQYAVQIENVQQYMSDYDYFTKLPAYRYLTATSLPDRVLSMFHHKDQQHLVDSMQTTAHNLDTQTKELLDAVDKTMADDFTQHAGQWLLQVDDPTQVNELIDRYGKQRNYASMRELLTDLQSLHKLREDVKQQVSDAVGKLHDTEATAAAIAVPERNGDLDPADGTRLPQTWRRRWACRSSRPWNSAAEARRARIQTDSWRRTTARCPTARNGMSCISSPRTRIGRRPREARGWWIWSSMSFRIVRS